MNTILTSNPSQPFADSKIPTLHKAIYKTHLVIEHGGLNNALENLALENGIKLRSYNFPNLQAKFNEFNLPPCL